jgi:regulator of replication initiation timing
MPDLPDEDASGDDAPAGDDREAPPALEDLRDAVGRATRQIERLSEENARLEDENERLRERVDELEADPAAGRDGTAVLLDDEPEDLRARIDRFIDAIDAHLE